MTRNLVIGQEPQKHNENNIKHGYNLLAKR